MLLINWGFAPSGTPKALEEYDQANGCDGRNRKSFDA